MTIRLLDTATDVSALKAGLDSIATKVSKREKVPNNPVFTHRTELTAINEWDPLLRV